MTGPDVVPAAVDAADHHLDERVALLRDAVHLLGGDVGELVGGDQVGPRRRGPALGVVVVEGDSAVPLGRVARRSRAHPGRSTGTLRRGGVESRAPGLARLPPGGTPPSR